METNLRIFLSLPRHSHKLFLLAYAEIHYITYILCQLLLLLFLFGVVFVVVVAFDVVVVFVIERGKERMHSGP